MDRTHFDRLATGSVLPIWPGPAPGSEEWTWVEQELSIHGDRTVRNVSVPTLEFVAPTVEANGTSLIIAPGGGFHYLSIDHEGIDFARRVAAQGIAAFVLRYRVRHTPEDDAAMLRLDRALAEHLERTSLDATTRQRLGEEATRAMALAMEDGRQAVRVLRARAETWGLDGSRVGFVGFSAGARVAMGAAISDAESRPDFVGALYGPRPEPLVVPPGAPELFLAHAYDDPVVAATESVQMWTAWREAGRSAELHLFRSGGHGYGTKLQGADSDTWPDLFEGWLRGLALL